MTVLFSEGVIYFFLSKASQMKVIEIVLLKVATPQHLRGERTAETSFYKVILEAFCALFSTR